jgi:hypothetical protein
MNLSAIRSASKKFLVTRETANIRPSFPAFARLLEAQIDLHRSIDPNDEEFLWTRIAIRLLRFALEVVGDVTMFWKKWFRF